MQAVLGINSMHADSVSPEGGVIVVRGLGAATLRPAEDSHPLSIIITSLPELCAVFW